MRHNYERKGIAPTEWGYVVTFVCVNGQGPEKDAMVRLVTEQLLEFEVGKRYVLKMELHE